MDVIIVECSMYNPLCVMCYVLCKKKESLSRFLFHLLKFKFTNQNSFTTRIWLIILECNHFLHLFSRAIHQVNLCRNSCWSRNTHLSFSEKISFYFIFSFNRFFNINCSGPKPCVTSSLILPPIAVERCP